MIGPTDLLHWLYINKICTNLSDSLQAF